MIDPRLSNRLLKVFGGLAGTADTVTDEEHERFQGIPAGGEAAYKDFIREEMLRESRLLDPAQRADGIAALEEVLADPDFDYEDFYESLLPAFDPPAEVRDFFVWLHELLSANG